MTRSIALFRDTGIVGHDQERGAEVSVETAHELEHVARRLGVEIAGRLVGQNERRAARERACDRDALLLASGQLRRLVVHAMFEPDRAQQLPGPSFDHRRWEAFVPPSGEHHVLECSERREQVMKLEHEAERSSPESGEPDIVELGCVRTSEDHATTRRALEQTDHVEQRTLARSRWANERRELARSEAQVDPVERACDDVFAVVHHDTRDLEERLRPCGWPSQAGVAPLEAPE
jgi:hypothetical protein